MSLLLRWKLGTCQRTQQHTYPKKKKKLPAQCALSLDQRTGWVGWRYWGEDDFSVGSGTKDKGMTVLLWLCINFWSKAGGHCWETESSPLHPILWMQIVLHYWRVQRDLVIFSVSFMNVGFVLGSSRKQMNSLISITGQRSGLLFCLYGNQEVKSFQCHGNYIYVQTNIIYILYIYIYIHTYILIVAPAVDSSHNVPSHFLAFKTTKT